MTPYRLKVIRELNNPYPESHAICSAAHAAKYLRDNVFTEDEAWREQAFVLTLDAKNNITGILRLSQGTTEQTSYDVRLIIKTALDTVASGVILAHNHTHDDPTPSPSDIRRTGELKNALRCFDIKLIDHIILADKSFFSFNEEKKQKLN